MLQISGVLSFGAKYQYLVAIYILQHFDAYDSAILFLLFSNHLKSMLSSYSNAEAQTFFLITVTNCIEQCSAVKFLLFGTKCVQKQHNYEKSYSRPHNCEGVM